MFVHQGNYTKDVLKKFDMGEAKPLLMPMSTIMTLYTDEEGEAMDQKEYHSMIESLLYLMAMRLDIQFATCLCACFQASSRTYHRQAVKRIMRYLQFTPEFELWFLASSSLSLCGYSDMDFAGCRLDESPRRGLVSFSRVAS